MSSNDNNIEIKSDKKHIEIEDEGIEKYIINENNKIKSKNFKQKRINNVISDENIAFPSEKKIFRIRDKLTIKDDNKDEIKAVEILKGEEKSEKISTNLNNEENNVKNEGKKGFFGKTFGWLNYLYNEIPYFWKKEELVKGYDANGNIVYRPKKKIPLKENNYSDVDKISAENEANYAGVDYTTKGINYGVYFN